MTADQIIQYCNQRLNSKVTKQFVDGCKESSNGLKLSPVSEKYIREKYKKSGDEGFSEFWKTDTSNYLLEDSL